MKLLTDPWLVGPEAMLECDCGEQFMVNACGEENMDWDEEKRTLVAVCPKCGRIDGDETFTAAR